MKSTTHNGDRRMNRLVKWLGIAIWSLAIALGLGLVAESVEGQEPTSGSAELVDRARAVLLSAWKQAPGDPERERVLRAACDVVATAWWDLPKEQRPDLLAVLDAAVQDPANGFPAIPDPDPEPDPDPQPDPDPGQLSTTATSNGITWTFAEPETVGLYLTGDPWVVGPVTVVKVDPARTVAGGRVMHGSMIDPDVGWAGGGGPGNGYPQGFDSSTRDNFYLASLDVEARMPIVVQGPASLVSARSYSAAGTRPQLTDVGVLTVVDAPPPADAFRPAPYAGVTKDAPATLADVDFGLLPLVSWPGRVPLVPIAGDGIPDQYVTPRQAVARIWFDPAPDPAARPLHPANQMPTYGAELADTGGACALASMEATLPEEERRAIAIGLVQVGLDQWGVVSAKGFRSDHWLIGGGHASGRIGPILYAGHLLGRSDMLGVRSIRPEIQFNETGQTYYRSIGVADWCSQYLRNPSNCGTWGNEPDAAYRTSDTARAWWGWAAALRALGLRDALAHEAFFDYLRVYYARQVLGQPNAPQKTHATTPWTLDAWRKIEGL